MSAAPIAAGTCKLALCQMLAGADKAANLATARAAIAEAAAAGAQLIALPECFNSPYATDQFPVYAEPIPAHASELTEAEHPSTFMLSRAAAAHGVFLVGGSIPERGAGGRVYNACVAFGPDGAILTKHRKVHLFDIDIPGRITFRESDTLSPGGPELATFDTPFGRCGLGVRGGGGGPAADSGQFKRRCKTAHSFDFCPSFFALPPRRFATTSDSRTSRCRCGRRAAASSSTPAPST